MYVIICTKSVSIFDVRNNTGWTGFLTKYPNVESSIVLILNSSASETTNPLPNPRERKYSVYNKSPVR